MASFRESLSPLSDMSDYAGLEECIDTIARSYRSDEPINNLESSSLPNKRQVIAALQELEPVLFMGFYATRGLNPHNLRHALAEHIYRAHDMLVEQVERALAYEHWQGRCEECPGAGDGDQVVLQLFRALPEVRRRLNLDLKAAYDGDPASESIEEIVFSYPSIKAITAYRVAHELWRLKVPLLPRIMTEYAHSRTGIDLHPGAAIGERFFIDHGTGVVIGSTTEIGNNVKLYQGVTLGALSVPGRDKALEKRHPTLEDDVTVYAGATILGGNTVIGKGATIGANVWVVRSVEAGEKV
ncbi:MAG: serine O-acetyltransferase EpsC, partial [Myxococcota bacterium]